MYLDLNIQSKCLSLLFITKKTKKRKKKKKVSSTFYVWCCGRSKWNAITNVRYVLWKIGWNIFVRLQSKILDDVLKLNQSVIFVSDVLWTFPRFSPFSLPLVIDFKKQNDIKIFFSIILSKKKTNSEICSRSPIAICNVSWILDSGRYKSKAIKVEHAY